MNILVGGLCADSYSGNMCESGTCSYDQSLGHYRCWGTDLSLGAACLNDDMCSSRVCRDGICVEWEASCDKATT